MKCALYIISKLEEKYFQCSIFNGVVSHFLEGKSEQKGGVQMLHVMRLSPRVPADSAQESVPLSRAGFDL